MSFKSVKNGNNFNPIENVFAKLKALVRKAKLRTVEELWNKLEKLCDMFFLEEYKNYFKHAGYGKIETPDKLWIRSNFYGQSRNGTETFLLITQRVVYPSINSATRGEETPRCRAFL